MIVFPTLVTMNSIPVCASPGASPGSTLACTSSSVIAIFLENNLSLDLFYYASIIGVISIAISIFSSTILSTIVSSISSKITSPIDFAHILAFFYFVCIVLCFCYLTCYLICTRPDGFFDCNFCSDLYLYPDGFMV